MKRHRAIIVSAGFLLVIGITLVALRPREPVYQGKPVSFWFKKYVFSFSPAREEALETIAEIGSDAVPYLARMLKKKDSPIARAYRALRPKLPLTASQFLPQPIEPERRRADALACLGRLSRSFNTALEPLIEVLNDPETRIPAIQTLPDIRSFGPLSERIAAALAAAAQNPSPSVRQAAIKAIFWVLRSPDLELDLRSAIPALMKAVDDSDREIWIDAAVALREMGPAAREAVSGLRKTFEDPNIDAEKRLLVASAWLEIEPDSAHHALEYLIANKLKSWEPSLSDGIPVFFANAKWSAQAAIPSLIALLRGDTASVCSAALALGCMGNLALEAAPALHNNMESGEPVVRLISALALRQIDPDQTQAVVPVLSNLLENVTYGLEAAHALADIGPPAHSAVPALVALLEHEWPYFREAAGHALWRIDPTRARKIVPVFVELLHRKDITYSSRLNIVATLGKIGREAQAAAPIMMTHLNHRDRRIQLAAAEALLKIDERQSSVVVPFLIEYLRRTDQWDRDRAAEMLGQLGPKAKAAAPALREATKDADPRVRANATEALKKIED